MLNPTPSPIEVISQHLQELWEMGQDQQSQYLKNLGEHKPELAQHLTELLRLESSGFMAKNPGIEVRDGLRSGEQFGDYQIREVIGRGGMSCVYLAQKTDLDVPFLVALKVIQPHLRTPNFLRRFQTEQQLLAQLQHPNIARFIDAGTVDRTPYLATAWVDGENIRDYVTNSALTLEQRLNLFLLVCDAVSYAHSQSIIHRDIKPANILVDQFGVPQLLDFGIARIAAEETGTRTSTHLFTPDYAAPEQLLGQSATPVTDVYALGIVLFELITGQRRFKHEHESPSGHIENVLNPKTRPASEFVVADSGLSKRHIQGDLDLIIAKAIHVDPARRYRSVDALQSDIQRFLNNQPVSAGGDSLFYRMRMFAKRYPIPVTLLGLLIVTLSAGLGVSMLLLNKAEDAQRAAQRELTKNQEMQRFYDVILGSGSPILEGGSTQITLADMLRVGDARYNIEDISDEWLRAEIAMQISVLFGENQQQELRRKYAEIARDIWVNRLAMHADDYMTASKRIALSYREQNQYSLALSTLESAYSKVAGVDLSPDIEAEVLIEFAQISGALKDLSAAADYLDRADILATSIDYAAGMGKVAFYRHVLFQDSLDAPQALAYLEAANHHFSRAYQSAHPNLIAVQNSYALHLKEIGQYQRAAELLESVNQNYLAFYGNPLYTHLINLADAYFYLGDFKGTMALTRQALEDMASKGLQENFNWLAATVIRARASVELGSYAVADRLYVEARAFIQDRFPENPTLRATITTYELEYQTRQGFPTQADSLAEVLLADVATMNADSQRAKRRLSNAYFALGVWQLAHKRWSESADYFRKARVLITAESTGEGWRSLVMQLVITADEKSLQDRDQLSEYHELKRILGSQHWYMLLLSAT